MSAEENKAIVSTSSLKIYFSSTCAFCRFRSAWC